MSQNIPGAMGNVYGEVMANVVPKVLKSGNSETDDDE